MCRVITSFVCLIVGVSLTAAVKVCPTLSDYQWFNSRQCYNNPISEQNITEIIRGWGFTAEEHYVTSQDGYELLLERLYSNISQPNPIIIVHGIAMNPLGWVIREKRSIAYLLAQQGYDVWMVNFRGTWYSKKHLTLSPDQDDFWKYTVDDVGMYDIRTSVEHVNSVTRQQGIYIGYSMGSTGFFVYSTTFPDEAERYIKGMIGLAPVINFKDAKSFGAAIVPFWTSLKPLVYAVWHGEILPGFSGFLQPMVQCNVGITLIQTVVNLLFGVDYDQIDPITYPLFTSQLLDSIGAEVFSHYIQIHNSGKFQKYDHGKEENMKRYGTVEPPVYNLSKIPVPVAVFVGANDWLSSGTNSKQLYSELQPSSRCGYHVVPFKKWNHIDFLIGKDLQKYLYDDLFHKIKQMADGKCPSGRKQR